MIKLLFRMIKEIVGTWKLLILQKSHIHLLIHISLHHRQYYISLLPVCIYSEDMQICLKVQWWKMLKANFVLFEDLQVRHSLHEPILQTRIYTTMSCCLQFWKMPSCIFPLRKKFNLLRLNTNIIRFHKFLKTSFTMNIQIFASKIKSVT